MSYFYREAFLTFLPWFRWSIFGTIAASQRPFRILSAFCGFLFLTRNKPQRTLKTMQRPQGAMGLSFSGLHGQGLQNRILHLLSFAKTFKPFGARFAAKPSQLPLRVMAYVELGLFDSTGEIPFAFKVFNHAPVAVGAQCIRVCRDAVGQKCFNFFHQPGGKMPFRTVVDALVNLAAGWIQNYNAQMSGAFVWLRPRTLLLGHCRAGLQTNFDRAFTRGQSRGNKSAALCGSRRCRSR